MKLEISENLKNALLAKLPHGSGIDYEYEFFTSNRSKKLYIENAYHYMNEYGFYDGILPFTVIIDNSGVKVIFHVNGAGRYRVNKADLKNYLEELFFEALYHKF